MPPTRRVYVGGGSAQTLSAPLTSVALSATLTDNAGWPTSGPFSVVLDRGTGVEEKILVASQSGNTLTIQARGVDGSAAWAHTSGAAAELCPMALDFDEANAHTSAIAGVHGITGSVVGTSDAQTLDNKQLTAPIVLDLSNMNHDHSSTAQGGNLSLAAPTAIGLTYSAGWANNASPYAPGVYSVSAEHRVFLSGAPGASAGAGTVATGLPHPADARTHNFAIADLFNATFTFAAIDASGVLTINAPASGHTYSLDGITYQS